MLWNALIRTHHITSRKKVAVLKKTADKLSCYALVKYGGPPGIMYCEGPEESVRDWVAAVNRLRYKDYLLVSRPAEAHHILSMDKPGLHEVTDVKDFAGEMEQRGILSWWKVGMGYTPSL